MKLVNEVELLVGLKIPDTTAITAFHTLEKLGYKITKLKRKLYYKFSVSGDAKSVDQFKEQIVKTDIIVNANKNTAEFIEGDIPLCVLVKDIGVDSSLVKSLNNLGLKGVSGVEKGVLWTMDCDKETAEKIAKDLLANIHYQTFEIRGV